LDKQPLILVADDDSTFRFLAAEALEPAGFIVAFAGDGEATLAQARRLRPDLIMLDVQMPHLDGFQLCKRLRSDPTLTSVPIVMVTGQDDVASIECAYQLGATSFIGKPIRWNTLAYHIRYVLRNSRLEEDLRVAKLAEHRLELLRRENAERRRAEAALRVSEIRYRRLFEAAKDGILLLDFQSEKITDVNASLLTMLGYGREAFLGKRLWEVKPFSEIPISRTTLSELQTSECVRFEHLRLHTRDGAQLDVEFVGNIYRVDGNSVMQCNIRDITEREEREARIRHMALHDALTGLPNRLMLQSWMNDAIARARSTGEQVAILILDFDHFKRINDSLGHRAGDQFLEAAALRLSKTLRENDIVARLGGDEFVIGLRGVGIDRDAALAAREAQKFLSEPYFIDGRDLRVDCSIGISLWPDDGEDPGILLRAADTAMYEAKEKERSGYRFFTPALNEAAQRSFALATDVHGACARGEFVLHYQPIVSIASGNVTGVEALLRWRHPERGLIPPSHFIPALEESGLIIEVGSWVLQTACLQNARWQAEGLPPIRMAVNLSARQFFRGDVVRSVDQALRRAELSPEWLELELTESLTLGDTEATIGITHELKRLGVSLSLDDFGTGWSSLSYLRRFPLDRLKIDRSFMCGIERDASAAALVRSIVSLAGNLGLTCIAEGVETPEQLAFLRKERCAEAQGFLFNPALPAAESGALLRTASRSLIA
jgi:diguanylate cyclase (GGDEF)-like protein/PAS domain S-box-containing protein